MYNMRRVSIHIANPEVERLAEQYRARLGTTKTEAILRALQIALRQPDEKSRRARIMSTGLAIIQRARAESRAPLTKEETDALYSGMDNFGRE